MRISQEQIVAIRTGAAQVAGKAARVWLFGSRVRDQGRGGDVGLMRLPIHAIAMAEGIRL